MGRGEDAGEEEAEELAEAIEYSAEWAAMYSRRKATSAGARGGFKSPLAFTLQSVTAAYRACHSSLDSLHSSASVNETDRGMC